MAIFNSYVKLPEGIPLQNITPHFMMIMMWGKHGKPWDSPLILTKTHGIHHGFTSWKLPYAKGHGTFLPCVELSARMIMTRTARTCCESWGPQALKKSPKFRKKNNWCSKVWITMKVLMRKMNKNLQIWMYQIRLHLEIHSIYIYIILCIIIYTSQLPQYFHWFWNQLIVVGGELACSKTWGRIFAASWILGWSSPSRQNPKRAHDATDGAV